MTEQAFSANRRIVLGTLIVDSYEAGLAFYCGVLGFACTSDQPLGDGKRWVTVQPTGVAGAGLLLAQADGAEQIAAIGKQTAGRVGFFLHTDDFARDHATMLARKIRFLEEPRHEPYGTVAVFSDPYGNLWDLIQPAI